jgi:excisionase family DNA binding protein
MNTHVPRVTLRFEEAAASLGVSRSAFYERVLPELRCITVGRTRLVPVVELEAWAEREARRLSAVVR